MLMSLLRLRSNSSPLSWPERLPVLQVSDLIYVDVLTLSDSLKQVLGQVPILQEYCSSVSCPQPPPPAGRKPEDYVVNDL